MKTCYAEIEKFPNLKECNKVNCPCSDCPSSNFKKYQDSCMFRDVLNNSDMAIIQEINKD